MYFDTHRQARRQKSFGTEKCEVFACDLIFFVLYYLYFAELYIEFLGPKQLSFSIL